MLKAFSRGVKSKADSIASSAQQRYDQDCDHRLQVKASFQLGEFVSTNQHSLSSTKADGDIAAFGVKTIYGLEGSGRTISLTNKKVRSPLIILESTILYPSITLLTAQSVSKMKLVRDTYGQWLAPFE